MSNSTDKWQKPFYLLITISLIFQHNLLFGQTNVEINTEVQRYIGDVSYLERNKFFNLHSNSNDQDLFQFYEEYNAYPSRGFWGPFSYSKNRGNNLGQYPSFKATNDNVKNVSRFVATEHPRSLFYDGINANEAGDWVVNYYSAWVNDNERPMFFEPMNEPFVHAVDFYEGNWISEEEDRIKRQMAEVFNTIGAKIHNAPALSNMKVIGYSAAWPSMELRNFSHWDENMKMFMDVAGDNMDAFATHLYDGVNVTGQNNLRSGSNSEAILDLIETYSYNKWNLVKPHALTEYGGITRGFSEGYSDLESIQTVRSINHMLFNFLDRENVIDISIPFITDKSTWHLTAENNYQPYGAALFIPTNIGEANVEAWEFSPKIYFYELWKDVNGKRLQITSDNPDVQVQCFNDENIIYVAFNNLSEEEESINLSFINNLENITSLSKKSLKIYDELNPEFTITNEEIDLNTLALIPGETVLLTYTLQSSLEINEVLRETKYYTSTHLQPILANNSLKFNFDNVITTNANFATIQMGIGRKHKKSKTPVITVNGTEVLCPNNWKGSDQSNRDDFFGVIEIPFDVSLLQTSNEISITFPDNDGHVSSVILEVHNLEAPTTQVDDIGIISPLTEVLSGNSVTINLSYSATQSRDVVVEFWSADAWLGEARQTVEAGEDSVSLNIQFTNEIVVGDGYIIKASIRPVGTDWTENISRDQINDIMVVSELTGDIEEEEEEDNESNPLFTINLTFTDESQSPIKDVELNFHDDSLSFQSDINGQIKIDSLVSNNYHLVAEKEGYNTIDTLLEITNADIDITLVLVLEEVEIEEITLIADAGEDQTVYSGEEVTFDGSNSSPNDVSYLWLSNDGLSFPNNNASTFSFIAPEVEEEKSFTFRLTISKDTISAFDEVILNVIPNIEEPNSIDDLQSLYSIYPNPVISELIIDTSSSSQLYIYDLVGNSVFNYKLKTGINKLDLSGLTKGMYIVSMENGQSIYSKKLFKM